ncbi:hypothetical protein JCM8097_000806 [Rhodosporidiobolus ruineniae]
MSTAGSFDVLPTTRGFSDLPNNIQARIVQLCAEQDGRFREWVKGQAEVSCELERNKSWYGRSLSALFQVSKKLSSLAAPHVYLVLKTSKVDLRFKCLVAPTRLAFFEELHLDSGQNDSSVALLPYLPHLSAIRKLVVTKYALDHLWAKSYVTLDWQWHSPPSAQLAASAFSCLRNLVEIEAADIRTGNVSLLSLAPFARNNSETLRILDLSFDYAGPLVGLGDVLRAAPNLTDLTLTCTGDLLTGSPFNPGSPPLSWYGGSPPPLQNLSITAEYTHSSQMQFAGLFRRTLERLSLKSQADEQLFFGLNDKSDTEVHLIQAFERLSTLALSGDFSLTRDVSKMVEPEWFPSLRNLELDIHHVPSWSSANSPLTSFQSFPELVNVLIKGVAPSDKEAVFEISALAEANDWDLRFLPLESSGRAIHSSSSDSSSDSESSTTPRAPPDIDGMRKTLEFAMSELEGNEDSTQLRRFEAILGPLEAYRLAKEAWMQA